MPQMSPQPDDDQVIRQEQRDIKSRGDGGAIYLNKSELEDLGFKLGQRVDVQYVVRDGSLALEAHADSPGGFTKEQLLDFAMEQEWTRLHGLSSGGQWAYTFEDATGMVSIEINSEVMAGDEILDNISVIGPLVPISEDLGQFNQLAEVAEQDSLCRVEIQDNEGLWEQFDGAAGTSSEIPDRDVIRQLTRKADTVKARLVATRPSVLTSLDEVQSLVDEIRTRSDVE